MFKRKHSCTPGAFRDEVGDLLAMTFFGDQLKDAFQPGPESPLWRLETLLWKEPSIGRVKASKLIARKRPHWNTIYDDRGQ
ncbi:DUF6308 family protein [Corynebacterium pilosum]|uniref:Uncharacterized protein n=1 Tax=Corynebacterium pilosum TaxID=35756 RepID=A0A376CJC0_9CORY|nr:DUF6308 family protein [Corynebacterium pilosum]STC68534.1 Uncharacterised protein [Corynebacterium pilosum]